MGTNVNDRVVQYRKRKRDAGICIAGGCWAKATQGWRCSACAAVHADRQRRTRSGAKPQAKPPRPARRPTALELKKRACRMLTAAMVKTGEIERAPCQRCNGRDSQAHHTSYSDPRAIVWLCQMCHAAQHRGRRPAKILSEPPIR